jgi:hypothetical protein
MTLPGGVVTGRRDGHLRLLCHSQPAQGDDDWPNRATISELGSIV